MFCFTCNHGLTRDSWCSLNDSAALNCRLMDRTPRMPGRAGSPIVARDRKIGRRQQEMTSGDSLLLNSEKEVFVKFRCSSLFTLIGVVLDAFFADAQSFRY